MLLSWYESYISVIANFVVTDHADMAPWVGIMCKPAVPPATTSWHIDNFCFQYCLIPYKPFVYQVIARDELGMCFPDISLQYGDDRRHQDPKNLTQMEAGRTRSDWGKRSIGYPARQRVPNLVIFWPFRGNRLNFQGHNQYSSCNRCETCACARSIYWAGVRSRDTS